MIRVCKKKTIDRLYAFGCGLWYAQNVTVILSLIHLSLVFLDLTRADYVVFFSLPNSVLGCMFNAVFYDSTIWNKIKDKQKLFGWDDSC